MQDEEDEEEVGPVGKKPLVSETVGLKWSNLSKRIPVFTWDKSFIN
jgi:hypothetical protein